MQSDRKRQIEQLWRRRLPIAADEKRAHRRFVRLMRGFDDEDLAIICRAVETNGRDSARCAPGPPMDVVEETQQPTCSKLVVAADMLRKQQQNVVAVTAVANHTDISTAFAHIPPPPPSSSSIRGSVVVIDPTSVVAADPLAAAVESGLIPQIDGPMSIPYLCCKMWRWRELQTDAALHRFDFLPWCRFKRMTIAGTTVSCCNPYHYALWIKRKFFFLSFIHSVSIDNSPRPYAIGFQPNRYIHRRRR